MTTGPWRPPSASEYALATISGIRAGSSSSKTPLAIDPNTARQSISWKASRPRCPEATWPTSRISGVESWPAVWIPTAAWVAPGPRVTMHSPGCPVSLP